MPFSQANSKRTRSQLTLPDFNFQLSRSPLKDARTARRAQRSTPPAAQQVAGPADDHLEESSLDKHTKRASSPLKEVQPAKRQKHDEVDLENQPTAHTSIPTTLSLPEVSGSPLQNSTVLPLSPKHRFSLPDLTRNEIPGSVAHDQIIHDIPAPSRDSSHCILTLSTDPPLSQRDSDMLVDVQADIPLSPRKRHRRLQSADPELSPRKPHSVSSPSKSTSGSAVKRAMSVPPGSPASIPHLDLNRMPSSPSKQKGRLLFVSIPPPEPTTAPVSGLDVHMTETGPASAPGTLSLRDAVPSTPTFVFQDATPPLTRVAMPPASSSPLTPLRDRSSPSRSPFLSPVHSPSPLPPPQGLPADLALTDDDPTPRPKKRSTSIPPTAESVRSRPSSPSGARSRPVTPGGTSGSEARSRPITPSTSSSRLPRLSVAPGMRPLELQQAGKAQEKEKGKEKKPRAKSKVKPTPLPLGGRMTRSAALRQLEIKRKEEMRAGASTAPLAKVTASPAVNKIRTFSQSRLPFAPSTSSATTKSNTTLQEKARPKALPNATASSSAAPLPGSSLTTLSTALEKLNLPPPSRPPSSIGYTSTDASSTTGISTSSATSSTKPPQLPRTSGTLAGLGRGRPLATPLKKASTVGDIKSSSRLPSQTPSRPSIFSGSSRPGAMAPPPVPALNGKARPPKVFGVGALNLASGRRMGLGMGRVGSKVSRQTSLQTVIGSPVKGGGTSSDVAEEPALDMPVFVDARTKEADPGDSGEGPSGGRTSVWTDVDTDTEMDPADEPTSADAKGKGKELAAGGWGDRVSRRASLASQLLSESINELPHTPQGARSGRSPRRQHAVRSAPGAMTGSSSRSASHVSAHGRKSTGGGSGVGSSGGKGPGGGGALTVLKGCSIYVDVRTDDGDDAGGLFVDMLKGMGAKMMTRVGPRCTHVVYKNGLMSTLTRYRLLNEPRPLVVGIAWVVECVEQRTRVDEARFVVDLENVNVAGSHKRRRSMLPKQLIPASPGPPIVPSSASAPNMTSPNVVPSNTSQSSIVPSNSPSNECAVEDGEASLPPLEKARRRRSMALGLPC